MRPDSISIAGVGDILPGGVLPDKEGSFVSEKILTFLRQADICVGTLETAVGNDPVFYEEKMARRADVIYVKDEDLKRLVELNISIVSLANNHFSFFFSLLSTFLATNSSRRTMTR